jgi:hypothetical protein
LCFLQCFLGSPQLFLTHLKLGELFLVPPRFALMVALQRVLVIVQLLHSQLELVDRGISLFDLLLPFAEFLVLELK